MLSPKELDLQCKVSIDRWVDLNSEEAKRLDPKHKETLHWFKVCQGPGGLMLDNLGRIFGKGAEGRYYPYHINVDGKLIGFRISAKALN
jgi:hypothetical protein